MPANANNTSDSEDFSELPEPIVTDMDLRSTQRTETEEILHNQIMRGANDGLNPDDKTFSGGRDTIVPEVLES